MDFQKTDFKKLLPKHKVIAQLKLKTLGSHETTKFRSNEMKI